MKKNILFKFVASNLICGLALVMVLSPNDVSAAALPDPDQPGFILPEPFEDINFYKCVLDSYENFYGERPVDTDDLALLEELACNNLGITSAAGIELLVKLTIVGLEENDITMIDVSKNVQLGHLYVDNILVWSGVEPEPSDEHGLVYDFSRRGFVCDRDPNFPVKPVASDAYIWDNNGCILTINDLSTIDDAVQFVRTQSFPGITPRPTPAFKIALTKPQEDNDVEDDSGANNEDSDVNDGEIIAPNTGSFTGSTETFSFDIFSILSISLCAVTAIFVIAIYRRKAKAKIRFV